MQHLMERYIAVRQGSAPVFQLYTRDSCKFRCIVCDNDESSCNSLRGNLYVIRTDR